MAKISYFKWSILNGVTSDESMEFLEMCSKEKGWENGYAVYIYLLERMFNRMEYWEKLDNKAFKKISRDCFIKPGYVLPMIKGMVVAGLFDKSVFEATGGNCNLKTVVFGGQEEQELGVLTSKFIQELYQTTIPACHANYAPIIKEYMLIPYDTKQGKWLQLKPKESDEGEKKRPKFPNSFNTELS